MIFRNPRTAGFTLIEVLVVVAILALLIAILIPALRRAREQVRTVVCQSALSQLHTANVFYLQAYRGIFPPHRYEARLDTASGPQIVERQWFHLLQVYTKSKELPHCPSLGSEVQHDRSYWQWDYDAHNLGYGYNAFFFGHYIHPDRLRWDTYLEACNWWPEGKIKVPSDSLLLGDSNPKNDGTWSSTLWWPYIDSQGEGLNGTRHAQGRRGTRLRSHDGGNLVFNDGHCEYRLTRTINPESDNTDQFIRFWDPLQRRKP